MSRVADTVIGCPCQPCIESSSALTLGSQISPGLGGRVDFPTVKGFITLQVKPAAKP